MESHRLIKKNNKAMSWQIPGGDKRRYRHHRFKAWQSQKQEPGLQAKERDAKPI